MYSRGEIRWLHLSDFHFREKLAWSQDVVLASLLKDVEERYSGEHSPNLLFLTGDIAFSGKPAEYVLAEEFIRALIKATALSPERLFLIPGNHDIDREREEDAWRGARSFLNSELEVDRFFADAGRRRTLFRRQEAFRDLARRLASDPTYTADSYAHWKTTTVGPLTVSCLLLDSSWLAEGGDTDAGSLVIGERQVIDALAGSKGRGLVFGLAHHPFAWLKEFEQVPIENLLIDGVHIMLRGHVHAADMRAVEALERRLVFFTAGAAFQGRTSDNTYAACKLNVLSGEGELITHRYVHAEKRWQPTTVKKWQLGTEKTIPLADALAVLPTSMDGRNYVACLLAGLVTEVPRQLGEKWVMANHETDIPKSSNPLREHLIAVRHLTHWKAAWDKKEWRDISEKTIKAIAQSLTQLGSGESVLQSQLRYQYQHCDSLVMSLGAPAQIGSFAQNLQGLFAKGEYEAVIALIGRSREASLLNAAESKLMSELEIASLHRVGRQKDATSLVESLMSKYPEDSHVYHVAAECYYAAKDYQEAAKAMHRALDNGAPVSKVSDLALHIAGQAGDASLRKRVLK